MHLTACRDSGFKNDSSRTRHTNEWEVGPLDFIKGLLSPEWEDGIST
jgi:hypothetical protein